jgi:D-alanine-D-alanine ligase
MPTQANIDDHDHEPGCDCGCEGAVPLRVALLYGGSSGEREVSCMGARNVRDALEAFGHEIVSIDTGKDTFLTELDVADPDVAFIALHGNGGEDGTIQGLLEVLGIPYTGSGVLASALCMDKLRSKILVSAEGITCPDAVVVDDPANYEIEAIVETIGLPCVVKPVADGSSLGISIVQETSHLDEAIANAFAVSGSPDVMIEAFVAGTEVTVAVLGNDETLALPVIQILPGADFYDYESKYTEGGSKHIVPAPLDTKVFEACQDAALQIHEILGCRGVSRSDFIVDDGGKIYFIEANTIPGMTSQSLLPEAAKAIGLAPEELYQYIIELALEDAGYTIDEDVDGEI